MNPFEVKMNAQEIANAAMILAWADDAHPRIKADSTADITDIWREQVDEDAIDETVTACFEDTEDESCPFNPDEPSVPIWWSHLSGVMIAGNDGYTQVLNREWCMNALGAPLIRQIEDDHFARINVSDFSRA